MTPPLLLAAHGTTDQAGVDAFAALTERVGKLAAADGTRVAGGFIELSEPPLREAVTGLAGASPGPMVAVPLMLSAAGHAKGDIPAALAEIMSRQVEPALVIGVPVGFVGAADAKDNLRASGLPALSNVSEKGGSAVAVAAFNALLRIARKQAGQAEKESS